MKMKVFLLGNPAKTFLGIRLTNGDLSQVSVVGVAHPLPSDRVRIDVEESKSPLLVLGQTVRIRLVNAKLSKSLLLDLGKLPSSLFHRYKSGKRRMNENTF